MKEFAEATGVTVKRDLFLSKDIVMKVNLFVLFIAA
jgi:hypothetical protein